MSVKLLEGHRTSPVKPVDKVRIAFGATKRVAVTKVEEQPEELVASKPRVVLVEIVLAAIV